MPGIYIHIPFCVQACHYCDFHFSTNRKKQSDLIDALCNEIEMRKDYLINRQLTTLYFGGGTPSLLTKIELEKLFKAIRSVYTIAKDAEITLEANPDDLTEENLVHFKEVGINRLSIGIQTFNNDQLVYLNRAHTKEQALASIYLAKKVGFTNISIDLIYGIPSPSHAIWESDLAKAMDLGVQHISSYCLTIEPTTVFGKQLAKKIIAPEDEEYNACQFEMLLEKMEENTFDQYEVSNFSQEGFISRHNSSYWQGEHYIGIGPGAHSYNGESRQYTLSNNAVYLNDSANARISFTKEILDRKMQANEYLMTRIRTKWGIDYSVITEKYNLPSENLLKNLEKHKKLGNLRIDNTTVVLTKKGLFIADKITEDLFYI